MPDPDQDAVVAGNATATDAEVGMDTPINQTADDRRAAEEAEPSSRLSGPRT